MLPNSLLLLFLCFSAFAPAIRAASQPVFHLDVPDPTLDKPQSKLWFAHGSWWAWLPAANGSGIWKRSSQGWSRQVHLDAPLAGLPGRADVWASANEAAAVLIGTQQLAVAHLRWDGSAYHVDWKETIGVANAETATITRDGKGVWWIAYDHGLQVWARSSSDWSRPIQISDQPTDKDDIAAIVALPGEIGVAWSNQSSDAVYFRTHRDGAPSTQWNAIEVVEQGNKTADDHISMAVAADGTLYMATKNSVDKLDTPQLVLRIRSPQGKWTNHPYANYTNRFDPSRPIVQLSEDGRLFLAHSMYFRNPSKPFRSLIALIETSTTNLHLAGAGQPVIDANTGINNVTGSKARLPQGRRGLILASDAAGSVYEYELP